MTKVSVKLLIEFNEHNDADIFYKSLIPDFKDFNIDVQGKIVKVELENLRPSRARALLNSILRLVQLDEEMRGLLV